MSVLHWFPILSGDVAEIYVYSMVFCPTVFCWLFLNHFSSFLYLFLEHLCFAFSPRMWFRCVWCKISAFIFHFPLYFMRACWPTSGMSWSAVDRWHLCWQRCSMSPQLKEQERVGQTVKYFIWHEVMKWFYNLLILIKLNRFSSYIFYLLLAYFFFWIGMVWLSLPLALTDKHYTLYTPSKTCTRPLT